MLLFGTNRIERGCSSPLTESPGGGGVGGQRPSPGKDNRGPSLLTYSEEQHEVKTGPLGNRNKLKMQVLSS